MGSDRRQRDIRDLQLPADSVEAVIDPDPRAACAVRISWRYLGGARQRGVQRASGMRNRVAGGDRAGHRERQCCDAEGRQGFLEPSRSNHGTSLLDASHSRQRQGLNSRYGGQGPSRRLQRSCNAGHEPSQPPPQITNRGPVLRWPFAALCGEASRGRPSLRTDRALCNSEFGECWRSS